MYFHDAIIEQDLIPFECSNLMGKKVLVFAPHPDDETLGCGGTLMEHVRYGDEVKIIFLTDGGKGDFAGKFSAESYTDIRRSEAIEACKVLGIDDLEFWDFEDRSLGSSILHFDRVKFCVTEYLPTLIYVTSPLELNPDHRGAANLVWSVIDDCKLECHLAFYEVSTPLQPNSLVDISRVIQDKKQAASCYASQMDPIDYYDLMVSMNRFRSLTIANIGKYAEAFVVMNSERIIGKKLSDYFTLSKYLKPEKGESNPLVSIIVRTQNRTHLLREALESIVRQSYKSIEVVVINDGGCNVDEIVESFKSALNLKLIQLQETRGRSAAANIGLENAKGDLLTFLDDDDIIFPDHIEHLVSGMKAHPEVQLVYSDCVLGLYTFREDGKHDLKEEKKGRFKGIDFNRDRLLQSNFIPIITAMFTRDLIGKSGLLDESLDLFEDWDLWIRMSMHSEFVRLPVITCEYRIFGSRSYDPLPVQMRIYEKYWHLCTPQNLMRWLHTMQVENDALKEQLKKYEDS